jgi:hypothetical protein
VAEFHLTIFALFRGAMPTVCGLLEASITQHHHAVGADATGAMVQRSAAPAELRATVTGIPEKWP